MWESFLQHPKDVVGEKRDFFSTLHDQAGGLPAGALESALPLTSWLTLVKLSSLSEPELAHLFNGDNAIYR